jgi:outer membrane protein
MKPPLKSLVAIAALSLTTLAGYGQTAPKILVVDLVKVFEGHWKTQEQNAKLQADMAKAQEQISQLQKDGNALVAQFKEMDDQLKNPAATAEAKAKIQADAQKQYDLIQQKRSELASFAQNAENTLKQRAQAFRTVMIQEISGVAVDIAKAKGATFLLDKSGASLPGVSGVIYADPSLDITDEVISQINKDRPAADASQAPATAPAGDSPKITVPGLAPAK